MIENDQEIPYDLYELTSGDLFMLIRVEAGEVSHQLRRSECRALLG